VRDAAANILENTSLADLIADPGPRAKGKRGKKKQKASVLPMVVGGNKGE
jgi:hypothetical protein